MKRPAATMSAILTTGLLLSLPARAQQSETVSRTLTGQAEALENRLIKTDYTSLGKINGAEVQAIIVTPAGKAALKGLLVYAAGTATAPEGSVFVDADEVLPLLASLKQLSELKTDFPEGQGHSEYRHQTRDGLRVGFYVKTRTEFAWYLLLGERFIRLDQTQVGELTAAIAKARDLLKL